MSLEGDYFQSVHMYICQILMEENQEVPMFPESAIQATEKSFYEALDGKVPSRDCPHNDPVGTSHEEFINSTSTVAPENAVESSQIPNPGEPQTSPTDSDHLNDFVPSIPHSSASSSNNVNHLVQMPMEDDQYLSVFHESAIQAPEKSLYEENVSSDNPFCTYHKKCLNSTTTVDSLVQMLMEDEQYVPELPESAIQAPEKSLYEQNASSDDTMGTYDEDFINSTSTVAPENVVESSQIPNPGEPRTSPTNSDHLNDFVPSIPQSSALSSNNVDLLVQMLMKDYQNVSMFQESAIQAPEKFLSEIQEQYISSDDPIYTYQKKCINSNTTVAFENMMESSHIPNPGEPQTSLTNSHHLNDFAPPNPHLSASSSNNVNPLVQMFMEDDPDVPTFHESAIQAPEKFLPEIQEQNVTSDDPVHTYQKKCINSNTTVALENMVESSHIPNPGESQTDLSNSHHSNDFVPPSPHSLASSSNNVDPLVQMLMEDDRYMLTLHESAIQAPEKSSEILEQNVSSDDPMGTYHEEFINSTSTVALENVVESSQIPNPGEVQTSPTNSHQSNDFVPPNPHSSASSSNNIDHLIQMLMEDDQSVSMLQESVFQAPEKSLNENLEQNVNTDDPIGTYHKNCINSTTTVALENVAESNQIPNPGEPQSSPTNSCYLNDFVPPNSPSSASTSNNASKGKKHHHEELSATNDCLTETQSNKQLARTSEEIDDLSDMLDKVSLCPDYNTTWRTKESVLQVSRGRKPQDKRRQLVDLKRLLTQCASSVSTGDLLAAEQILYTIRSQSSPHGDGTQRLAHYIATAIEARIHGTGTTLYADSCMMGISFADTLKAYQSYFTAVPFQRMSNIFANKAIYRQTMGATKLHIIDFGISYGFQWPCIIQAFSVRPSGSPYLRITGIDFPEPGFLPSKRVAKTGTCLKDYCKRFNIPFEYNCIAKKWDSIQLEDLKIVEGERLVVNCLYKLRQVPDETALESGPRNVVLKLIKRINPELLVLGVLNGSYNSAFFKARFRDALAHFSNLSDMFEATLAHEDKSRLVIEQIMLAKDAINVIACEGTARVERPEKYERWTSRIMKAGFMQTPLPREILAEVQGKVRLQYNKKFLVREDNNWMLQGWNGRVIYALSLWKPVQQ